MKLRFLRITLTVLSTLAAFLTGAGLLMSASLKNQRLTEWSLAHYSRYELAAHGLEVLRDFKYPVKIEDNQFMNVAVLDIDDRSWPVLLDFVRSEVAIRKSERNEPGNPPPNLQATPTSTAPQSPSSQTTPTPSPPVQVALPAINFDRVKTIVTARLDVMSAGAKPLVPPYSLNLLWPPPVSRRVYEFLSFEEFRLDVRQMLVQELESAALWLSVLAFGCGFPIFVLRWLVGLAEQRHTHTQRSGEITGA